jgi:hypothetical protein
MRFPVAALALIALTFTQAATQDVSAKTLEHLDSSDAAAIKLAHLEVELGTLPIDVHRRAVAFMELERERPASKWVTARLAERALPMFRPGDASPTYYELRVIDPEGHPLGYFVLSAGDHDHPVPIAVEEGVPSSHELALQIEDGQAVTRVHFFSAVSMVAEGARGQALARFGGLPPKIVAADPAWLELSDEARASRSSWNPNPDGTGRLEEKAPERRIELGNWRSWEELRRDYAENYAVSHEIMRRNAADDWESMRHSSSLAEGLAPGRFRELPLLSRGGAHIRVEGAGTRYARVERFERQLEGDEALAVFVDAVEGDDVYPLDLHFEYADGSAEVHHFAIARDVPGVAEAPAALPTGELGALPAAPLAQVVAEAAPECSKVVLRTIWNTYIYAKNAGGSNLEARGGWIGGWEIFRLEKAGTDIYALRAPNGKYVKAVWGGGGDVRVDGDKIEAYTKFRRQARPNGAVELLTFQKGMALRPHVNGVVNAATGGDPRLFLEYCSATRVSAHWGGANDPIAAMRNVRKYDQLKGSQKPNRAPCASGCGATAWAMIFGWADHMAHSNHPTWAHYKGLYRRDGAQSGADEHAPEFMWKDMPHFIIGFRKDEDLVVGVGNIIEEIRTYLNDWGAAGCEINGYRYTAPHIMAQARTYVTKRGIDIGLTADYDGLGIMTTAGKNNVLSQLRDHNRVVAIGIGHFSHYPIAYGYEHARFAAWDAANKRWASITDHRRFVVNMGWGKYGSSNVPFDSWFAGYVSAKPPK